MSFLNKEKLRFLISFILTIIVHALFLVILHYGVSIKLEALPEYSGPLYIELGEHSISEDEKAGIEEEKEKIAANTEKKEEKPEIEKAEAEKKNEEPAKKIKVEKKEQITEKKRVDSNIIRTVTKEQAERAREDAESEDRIEENTAVEEKVTAAKEDSAAAKEEIAAAEEESIEEEYIPGLEHASLDRLDKVIQASKESDVKTPTEKENKDSTYGDSVTDKKEGARIRWEDNRIRVPLSNPNPLVPDWVSREGITKLEVEVTFSLNPDGFLEDIKIKKSSGYPDVDISFTDALKKWRYSAGNSVENVKGTGTFSITLK